MKLRLALVFVSGLLALTAVGRDLRQANATWLLNQGIAFTPDQVAYSANPDGSFTLVTWRLPVSPPTLEQLQPEAEDGVCLLPAKYRKIGPEGRWVEKTAEEKAAVDLLEHQAAQVAKPIGQRQGENNFFLLCKAILTAAADPRATNSVIPKLTIDELDPLLTTIKGSDFMAGAELSIKMLSVDAALKRYSATWWDDAEFHPELLVAAPAPAGRR